jgi:5-methylcytosine-specific restriction endonuclease McrA
MVSVPEKIRVQVRRRAAYRCEYCLLPESYHPLARFHVEHIFGKKHAGRTELSNLTLACPDCNRKKGTIIGSRMHAEGELIPLFNPRIHVWTDHFELNWAIIRPKTDIGKITSSLLGFNDDYRVAFRE